MWHKKGLKNIKKKKIRSYTAAVLIIYELNILNIIENNKLLKTL